MVSNRLLFKIFDEFHREALDLIIKYARIKGAKFLVMRAVANLKRPLYSLIYSFKAKVFWLLL